MPPHVNQIPAERGRETPPPTLEQIVDLKQQGEEELFSLQSLISQTRDSIPEDDIMSIAELSALSTQAQSEFSAFTSEINASERRPSPTPPLPLI